MEAVSILFKNLKARFEQLTLFGFRGNGKNYTYSTSLLDGQFEMTVAVTKAGTVSAEIIDSVSGEQYVLHRIENANGPLVGKVRKEFEGVLASIAKNCFEPNVFNGKTAGATIRYVRETYRDELEFLWKKFPGNAVFRRKDNAKWYAALLTVQKTKLGLTGEDKVEVIDLRMRPEDIIRLTDGKRYFPGYHMNKKHWVTICLDGSVTTKEIFSRIDDSFVLAAK